MRTPGLHHFIERPGAVQRDNRPHINRRFDRFYGELERVAAGLVRREHDHGLQPAALVHEAYLRLLPHGEMIRGGRTKFLHVAARVMRQVLIDMSRTRHTARRGAGWRRVPLTALHVDPSERPGAAVELNDVLECLGHLHQRRARVVNLRFFWGLSVGETASMLGVGTTAVEQDWRDARAWLSRQLGQDGTDPSLGG